MLTVLGYDIRISVQPRSDTDNVTGTAAQEGRAAAMAAFLARPWRQAVWVFIALLGGRP